MHHDASFTKFSVNLEEINDLAQNTGVNIK